jgi:hypothetical protein
VLRRRLSPAARYRAGQRPLTHKAHRMAARHEARPPDTLPRACCTPLSGCRARRSAHAVNLPPPRTTLSCKAVQEATQRTLARQETISVRGSVGLARLQVASVHALVVRFWGGTRPAACTVKMSWVRIPTSGFACPVAAPIRVFQRPDTH